MRPQTQPLTLTFFAMASPIRQKRAAGRIQNELGQMLLTEVKDPRLALVSITRVTIDRELMQADVYVSALADDELGKQEVMTALDSAHGFLRREIGKRVPLRHTPQLIFHWDPGIENTEHVANLLDSLKTETREEAGGGPHD